MNCQRCEIVQATAIARSMVIVGKSLSEIATHLTNRYHVAYFVDKDVIYRSNNPVNRIIYSRSNRL